MDLLGFVIVSVITLRTYSQRNPFSSGVYGDKQKDFGVSCFSLASRIRVHTHEIFAPPFFGLY